MIALSWQASMSENTPSPARDLYVIGSSEGGVPVLMEILAELPEDFPGAILVVQHLSPALPSTLASVLDRKSRLPVKEASHGAAFEPGFVWVAPSDQHLLVTENELVLSSGARENRCRPAADPLFRSAAVAFGSRVTGLVISGNLDDGAAGLQAIKDCGGTTVVQDPDDAIAPGMPESALRWVTEIDHCVPAAELASLLVQLSKDPPARAPAAPPALRAEVSFALNEDITAEGMNGVGRLAPFSCPDCGGPLWEMNGDAVSRFRCHTGHAYTADSLGEGLSHVAERSLWAALRAMEERSRMLERLAERFGERGNGGAVERYGEEARAAREHTEVLRRLLVRGKAG